MEWTALCRWKVGSWQPCSAVCGRGHQRRMVACERALANGDYEAVDTDMCDVQTKLITVQDCHTDTQCHKWQTGPWSQVHVSVNLYLSTTLCVDQSFYL